MELKYKNLSEKIIAFRKQLKVKQETFGEMFVPKVKRSTIAHWETKRSEPSIEQIFQMAAFSKEREWWLAINFLDDEVSQQDQVDYDKSNGRRVNWLTNEDMAEMAADHDNEEYWEWLAKQESEPPKNGKLFEALQLPIDKRQEAIQSLLSQGKPGLFSKVATNPASEKVNADMAKALTEIQKDDMWGRRTKNFRQAVIHALTKKMPDAFDHLEGNFRKGTLRGKADYFDGTTVILIATEQLKYKNEALGRNLGKLLLLEKMHGSLLHKMLAVSVDLDNPKVNHVILEDVSVARSLGITLTYVTPDEEDALALEMCEFIKSNLEKKTVKVKGSLIVSDGESLSIQNGHTVKIEP